VSQARRVRHQDARGGRQLARRARRRHPQRDGPREPASHAAREGARGTLRNAVTTDGVPCDRAASQCESRPSEDGVRMDVKPGYRRTDAGVIPEEWDVRPLKYLATI